MRAHVSIDTLIVWVTATIAGGLTAAAGNGDTIYVCWDGSGDYLTIHEGIDAASRGDEVVVCDGVYIGLGNKNLDFLGKAITVRSENGPANCIIDCQGDGRGFYFHSGEDRAAVVRGFTIANGNAHDGGGLYCLGSSPTVRDCTFAGNSAAMGGGMCCDSDSNPTVANCQFIGNSAIEDGYYGGYGGGMANSYSQPAVIDCTFNSNVAEIWGGGMWNTDDSMPTVTNCTFAENSGHFGGGMCNMYDAMPTVTNCTFTDNSSNSGGGGMANARSDATVINCTFSGNSANYGGGMRNSGNGPTVVNCTFSGNVAYYDGGGMSNVPSGGTVDNCTFSGNVAYRNGGAIHCDLAGGPTITNCILWADVPEEIYVCYCCEADVTYCDVEGGWDGAGNIDADPLFVDPENGDFHLAPGSPCIDAGDNFAVPACVFDLDGHERFCDDPATEDTGVGEPPIVDMGAYEFGSGPMPDCNENALDDDCEVAQGLTPDCNDNGIPDDCDITGGISNDCNVNGIPDECEVGGTEDCNGNGVPDLCDIHYAASGDCNGNGVPDECDIADATSDDYDLNGVPDECEDCNQNGVADACDLDCSIGNCASDPLGCGGSQDCNENGVPDECIELEIDCNGNQVPDECDIADGASQDCNENGIPDECDIADDTSADCNENDVPDECDLDPNDPDGDGHVSRDCQPNGIPDECDILEGTSYEAASEPLSPIGFGSPQSFTLILPPLAIHDVRLTFEAVADLAAMDEWIDVDINGVPVGRVFAGILGWGDCPSTPDRRRLYVPVDDYNGVVGEGDAVITMVASAEVDPDQCDPPSYIQVWVEYVAERDCNVNGIPDECDLAGGTSNDCNENNIPDECDLPADLDRDGDVDHADLGILLTDWGCSGGDCPGDCDWDGDTDEADLEILLLSWGADICP